MKQLSDFNTGLAVSDLSGFVKNVSVWMIYSKTLQYWICFALTQEIPLL